jgi:hypothetical protein
MTLRKVDAGLVEDMDVVMKKWLGDLEKVYKVFGEKGYISVYHKQRVVKGEYGGVEKTFEEMADEVGAETFVQWF